MSPPSRGMIVVAAHMLVMTDISPAAAAARESARHDNGRFGTQEHSAPEATLDSSDELWDALAEDPDSGTKWNLDYTGPRKEDDPRYVPGVSEHDDDMTDEEWYEAMGPASEEPQFAPKPFVWNRKHGDFEQVRPYMDEFLAVYDQVKKPAAGFVPDSEFVGRIPSLEGTEPREYERAIYMLQSLRRRDIVAKQVEEFTQAGGREITVHDLKRGQELRGTVVRYGWYVDGTGFQVLEGVRLRKNVRTGELEYVEKGKRNGVGIHGGRVMIKES